MYQPQLWDIIRPTPMVHEEYMVVRLTAHKMYFVVIKTALDDTLSRPGTLHSVDMDVAINATTFIRRASNGERTLFGY